MSATVQYTPTAPAVVVATIPAIPTVRRSRRRTLPAVRRVNLNGEAVVCIELGGRDHFHEMIVSARRWPEVFRRWGPHWLLIRRGPRQHWRVVCTDPEVAREFGVTRPQLARLLTNAGPEELVRHTNGNTLDLRDRNLRVVAARLATPKAEKGAR